MASSKDNISTIETIELKINLIIIITRNTLVKFLIMKKVLTIRSVLFNSFLVVTFAACGANAQKKTEICSSLNSEMLIPKNDFTQSENEQNSDPMILPKNPDFAQDSHPMVISSCEE